MGHPKTKQINNNNTYFFNLKQQRGCCQDDEDSVDGSDQCLALPSLKCVHACFLITVIATVCFGNSYRAQFVFDDSEAIIGNTDLKPETALTELFHHDFWGSKLTSNTSHKSYRPLTVLTFRFVCFLILSCVRIVIVAITLVN